MILGIQQDLKSEGIKVTISQLCRWFEVPSRTAYYKPCKAPRKVQERFEAPIKAMIDQDPSFGYRTVAVLLKFNKNTVQRIFQIRAGRSCKGPLGLDLVFRQCPRWPIHPMSVGPRTCAVFGRAEMVGRVWPW
jgi:putative transposase